MNTPKLRFKGFTDSWEIKKIKDIATVNQGLQIPISERFYENGKNRFFYITNEFLKPSSKVKYFIENPPKSVVSDEEDILMTRTGNTGQVVSNVSGAFHNNFFKINYNKSLISRDFLTNFLRLKTTQHIIMKYAGQSTIPDLNHSDFYKIKISYPNLKEQEKIGLFANELERKIKLQLEKIELLKEQKKGYMQKFFSQELRFKDEHGDDFPEWKTNIKADELFESVSNKNHNGDYSVLSATQEYGMIYRDTLERHMSFNDNNLKSYKLVEKDDFIISLRSFQGGIEFSTLQGLVSPAYTVFRKKNESVYNLYFAKVFKTANFITRLKSTTYGIRDGKAISYKDFSTLKFDVPSIEEQKKIAQFLDLQDRKISIEEKYLKELQNQKQAFMQQMFI